MAKGKTFTYVLLVGVALVWGIIFYRIYISIGEQEQVMPVAAMAKVPYFKMIDHQQDKVSLVLNYRDPFIAVGNDELLEKQPSQLQPSTNINVAPTRPVIQKPQVNWASIQYTGYVNNATSKQKMVILAINGSTSLLAEGQSANGLKLVKYFGDSVRVQYQGETKNIKIK